MTSVLNKKILRYLVGKKTVLIGGCFDIFHYGHLIFLKKAREQGDFLIVALESDQFIRKYKKRNPVHDQEQRAEILSAVRYVGYVIKLPLLTSDDEYFELVKMVRPSVIAVTEQDSQIENKKKQAAYVKAKLKIVSNLIPKFSTQKIIKTLSFEY